MVAGLKTGGRQKGTPNKPKVAAAVTGAAPAVVAPARETNDPTFPKYRTARVDSLVPYVNNARTHSPAQISKIAASIKEFGFTNPILTDGKRGIVAGHGRLLAAQKLGMETVPTLELSHLTKAQRRAYVIADNKLAEDAGWDDELLALELGELRDDGFNLELTGFDAGELKLIFADEESSGQTDPDDVPAPPAVPVSLLGDVWRLGRHTLHCADCRDVLPTLSDIDAVVTDPPYGIGKTSWDHTLPIEWFRHVPTLVGPTGAAYVFGDAMTISRFQVYWEGEKVTWKARISWCYEDGPRNSSAWTSKHEDCLFYAGPQHKLQTPKEASIHRDPRWGDDRLVGDVWRVPRVLGNYAERSDHPTQKPVALIEMPVSGSTKRGQVILDPYAGSGTTLIACEQLERSCVAVEIEPKYVDVTVKRWQNHTGHQATLESTGRTFAETEQERLHPPAQVALVKPVRTKTPRVKVAA